MSDNKITIWIEEVDSIPTIEVRRMVDELIRAGRSCGLGPRVA